MVDDGQLLADVENFPGYPDGVMGPAMMEDLQKQFSKLGFVQVADFFEDSKITRLEEVVTKLFLMLLLVMVRCHLMAVKFLFACMVMNTIVG